MWKKLLIAGIALVGSFSVAYIFQYNVMKAAVSYNAGGNVTGRVNKSPSNLVVNNSGMKKGDKVLMDYSKKSNGIGWILVRNVTYTDYGCTTSSGSCNDKVIDSWLSFATGSISNTDFGLTNADWVQGKINQFGLYANNTKVKVEIEKFNKDIKSSINNSKIIAPRNLTQEHSLVNNNVSIAKDAIINTVFSGADEIGSTAFLPLTIGNAGLWAGYVEARDFDFSEDYWSGFIYNDDRTAHHAAVIYGKDGVECWVDNSAIGSVSKAVRPAIYLNLSEVLFATSQGVSSDIAIITVPSISNSYRKLFEATSANQEMKLRLENSMLTTSTSLIDIRNRKNDSIAQTFQEATVHLNASASVGNDGNGGVNTVSVLVFDENNNFKYYKPLEPAKGSGTYEFDTTGIPVGKYKIGIVNEVYNENSTAPADSSAITDVLPLEIVEPLSNLSFTPEVSLEYSKNVNNGSIVGTISSQNGAGMPKYTLVADSSYPDDIDHFEMDADGKTVKVKGNALDAGTYHFKIQAQDGNGDPTTPLEISASITVAKTDPDLNFITTTAIDKVIGDSAFTESFTHNNTDLSSSKNGSLKFSTSLNTIATVDSPSDDTDTDIEITPGSINGSAIIKVELAETKNFKKDEATLTVNVHPKITLTFVADKHAFAISDVNGADRKVGSVNLTGNSPQYEYSIDVDPSDRDAGKDNSLFKVRTTGKTSDASMDVLTASPLPQGTYQVTVKVVDAYGQSAYAKGTISVSGSAQTGFDFYDYTNASKILTNKTLTLYYGEKNAKLIAKGGQSSGLSYDLDDANTSVIDVDQANGNITIKDIGKVKVKATKPADGTYSEANINMYVEVKPCKQTIVFNDTTDPKDVTFDSANPVILQDAIGKIKTGMPNEGKAGVGSISYSTSDTSIATVDSSGNVTLLDPGSTMKSFTLTATINDSSSAAYDPHYTTETITKTIKVYPKGSATWSQSNQPQADNNAVGDRVGKVNVSGGAGTPSFHIPTTTTVDNIDYSFFDIDSAGNVSILKTITHDDLVGKTINTVQNAYEMNIEVKVTNGGSTTTLPITIYIKGATRSGLEFDDKDPLTMEITKTYKEAPGNTFALGLNQVITGTTITYSLSSDAGNPSDVISVASDGTATILNANEGGSYQPAKVEALVPMCNGYEETVVKGNVRIKKADQVLVFSQDPINTDISVSSLNISVTGHKDSYDLVYSSSDSDIEVDPDASDSNQMIIKPNGKAVNGVTITALASGDRNYNSTSKPVTLNISATVTQPFVASFPKMTYGDTDPKAVTITPKDPSSTYTYTVTDTSILDIDSSGNITIHHAGDTTVQVSKTDASGTLGPYSFNVSVKQRPITVTIDNKVTYVGMELPDFTSQITSGSLVGSDTLGTLTYSCLKKDNTPVNKDSEADRYAIKGRYTSPNTDYKVTIVDGTLEVKQDAGEATWYHLEDIDGTTTTSSKWHKDSVDVVLNPSSASTAGIYDQIGNSLAFTNASTSPDRFSVIEEGETQQDIYFRIDPAGSDANKGATTSPIQETIRIDKTAPVIKSITGKNETSKVKEILNTLTLGAYFKPGFVVTINAEDVAPTPNVQVSGIAKTSYKVVQLDEQGNQIGSPNTIEQNDDTIEVSLKEVGTYEVCAKASDQAGNESIPKCEKFEIKKIDVDIDGDGEPDFNDPDGNGCADFNIIYTDEKDGKQKVLNVDANRDGIPEMNIDSDGDGKPDINVDTDGDGKPDLNLVIFTKELWKPSKCVIQHGEQFESVMDVQPQINIDLDFKDVTDISKAIPDINIDNIGDFKPHLNITNGNSTKPTLNLIDLHEWIPDQDYKKDSFQYDSIGTDKKAQINIDTDGDGLPDVNIDFDGDKVPDINIDTTGDNIPDLNIDSDGDGKPDISVDTNNDGIADENIVKITEWKPEKNGEKDGVSFDTMEIKGKSELEDNGIVVEKPDGTFLPNYAIKVEDVTEAKKEEVIKGTSDLIDETQEVKTVYDVKLLKDGIEVQPDGTLKVRIPAPEGVNNPILFMKKEDGTYQKLNVKVENGYLVYETNELGMISVIGEKEEVIEPNPDPIEKPTDQAKTEPPKPTVQGTYIGSIGGASTGDTTNILYLSISFLSAAVFISYILRKKFFK